MLKSLQIKNFAIIDSVELNFFDGFNIITGETGAGKSIIVDALMLALGERASSEMVRSGENKAIIEAVFERTDLDLLSLPNNELKEIFDDFDINLGSDELILRREVHSKGNSRCFINDTPASVSQLKLLGDFLVDFHGQHDHQLLLKPENHIFILDESAGLRDLIFNYNQQLNELKIQIKNYNKLLGDRLNLQELTEKFNLELIEIEQVSPKDNEEEILESQLKKIENFEQIFYLVNSILNNLTDNDVSAYNFLNQSIKDFDKLIKFEPSFNEHLNEINSSLITIKEISNILRDYASGLDIDNELSADEISLRLSKLKSLRKKYGSYDNIFQKRDELKKSLEIVDNIDFEIENLKSAIKKLKIECGSIAKKISKQRQSTSKKIEDEIQKNLAEMGMPDTKFKVDITQYHLTNSDMEEAEHLSVIIDNQVYQVYNNGIDKVEFLISTNKGEDLKRLSEIASGGEISRVMLSIKSIASSKKNMPILIFDEIDNGISGRIARKAGIVMKNLAKISQLIAITHLPQIASLASNHLHISKFDSNGRAKVKVNVLKNREKVQEIARLMSGEILTEASIKAAEELVLFD